MHIFKIYMPVIVTTRNSDPLTHVTQMRRCTVTHPHGVTVFSDHGNNIFLVSSENQVSNSVVRRLTSMQDMTNAVMSTEGEV